MAWEPWDNEMDSKEEMLLGKEEPLLKDETLDCPHAGCSYKSSPESLKLHIRECSFVMQEYIQEFLKKKENEIKTSNKSEEEKMKELQALGRALQQVHSFHLTQ